MKNSIYFLLFAPVFLACHSDSSDFGVEPNFVAYNDEASISKKSFCNDSRCDSPSAEDRYTYDAAGRVKTIESYGKAVSGNMEMFYFIEHAYNSEGLLSRKTTYHKHGAIPGWVAYNESDYEYVNGVLKLEKTYFNQHNPDNKVLTGSISYELKDGLKVGQKWFDDKDQLIWRVEYSYNNKVMTLENWYDNQDKLIRIFEHKFSGNRRQIGEYMLNSKEQLALIEKTYDPQGRLSTQETKVNNPLLCSLTPGMIKYSY